MPYHVSIVTGIYRGFERGGSFTKSLDASTREELGNPSHDWNIIKHVRNIILLYFEKHWVITQDQTLHGLIKHKKLKQATKLCGF